MRWTRLTRWLFGLLLSIAVFVPAQSTQAQTETPPAAAPPDAVPVPASANASPPIISSIDDQAIDEDGSTGPIAFTLTDFDTPTSQLSVSGSSSNGVLVPLDSIVFGGSGANRTVTISPPANLNGTARIVIIVSDGRASTFADFLLTVRSVNDAPTISAIASQTTQEDVTTNPIGFTVSDVDSDIDALVLSGLSSNPAVVAPGKVTFAGSGTQRTLRVAPVANQSGSSLITITVDDGSATSFTTFLLTVSPVNDAPVLAALPDRTVQEDAPVGPITLTVSDVDTSAANLSLSAASSNSTLLPSGNISIVSAGADRVLQIAPAANQSGSAHITVTVSDGSAEDSQSFTLKVNAVNDPPTISAIADQTIMGEVVGPLAFQVNDVDDDPASLVVSAKTSQPALVPLNQISIHKGEGGTGVNRTVTLTPTVGQTGAATITLTVSDGDATTQATFVVRVFELAYLPMVLVNAPCDTAAVDCYEPNNAIGQASTVPVTQTLIRGTLTETDAQDFYALTLTAGRRYTFALNTNGTDLDLYLYGVGPTYTQVAQSNISGLQNEQIEFVPPTTGPYYLLVYNYFASRPPLFKPYTVQLN